MKKNSILFLLLISSLCSSQEKILMVGNSFTFYYNLPNTIELMAKAKGLNWEVNQSSAGGTTKKYLGLLRTLIKQPTAQYVYSTWAYPNISSPAKGKITSQTIEKALKSMLGVRPNELILVGRAFDLFQERYPKYPLLTDDQKHPNPNGSYLAACIFFASFSELSTLGLPHREEGFDQFGKKIFYFIIEEEIALLCQKIADEVVLGMVKS